MFSSRKAHVENTLRTVRYEEERLKCARPFLAPQETPKRGLIAIVAFRIPLSCGWWFIISDVGAVHYHFHGTVRNLKISK